MKKVANIWLASVMALAFGFSSCESKTAENVENSAETAADEVEQEAGELKDKADAELTPTDTITVKDRPVQDGVADKTDN